METPFTKVGDLKGLFGLFMVQIHMLRKKLNLLDVSYGAGTGNTALVYHHRKLLALHEADKPSNAWEEEDEVVLISCRIKNPDMDSAAGAAKDKDEDLKAELYEMRFNMETGTASQKQLSVPAVEFPRINDSYTGRKQRYVYCTIVDNNTKVTGIIKFDLHAQPETGKKKLEVGGNVLGIFDLGPGRYGSEAVFVPRKPGTQLEEDDGYLIFFVHDDNTEKSEVNVIDAKTMSHEPVAVVHLPSRVPYGFHALFMSEEQLQNQQSVVVSRVE